MNMMFQDTSSKCIHTHTQKKKHYKYNAIYPLSISAVVPTASFSFSGYNPRLQDYLPYNFETLQVIGQDACGGCSFIEMCSLSKRYCHCKGIYPIFALPALHSVMLEPLFKQLQYPVFSTTISGTCSIEETAYRLYEICLHNNF